MDQILRTDRFRQFIGVVMACACAYGSPAAAEPLALAFLEDHYIENAVVAGKGKRDAYEPALRVAFVHDADGWRSVCGNDPFVRVAPSACPLEQFRRGTRSWKGFDASGHSMTAVSMAGGKKDFPYVAGLLKTKSPTIRYDDIGDRLVTFGGHSQGFRPARMPVPMTSVPFVHLDPDGWQESDLATNTVPDFLQSVVKQEFSALDQSLADATDRELPFRGELKMNLSGEMMRLRRHFKSRSSIELWQIEILQVWIGNYGRTDNKEYNPPRSLKVWAIRDKNNSLRMLGTPITERRFIAFDGFELIAQHDFDGDGNGELLFWYTGYVSQGYVLLSDGLTKLTTFTWGGN